MKSSDKSLIHRWVLEAAQGKIKYGLLWQGTRDGFGASVFHSKCNGKGPTVTVIVSSYDKIFGGYTSVSWGYNGTNSSWNPQNDATAFIFSLTHKAKCAKQLKTGYSIYDHCCPILMNCRPVPTRPPSWPERITSP